MAEDDVQHPATPPGPITEAYLHRDVHPDEFPYDKPVHAAKELDGPLSPKTDTDPDKFDDVWMYT